MNRRFACLLLITAATVMVPFRSPAPLIYTPGEGWTYEPYGGEGSWKRDRAKDQLIVAQEAFDKQDYKLSLKAARRTVKNWNLSDYAPQAQYLIGRSFEALGYDEKAFKAYQHLIDTYPQGVSYDDVLNRQYGIANRFLAGERFRLWGLIPLFPSMERTAGLFESVVKNGPFSEVAPEAQMKIGAAREKQSNYPAAAQAYERAADRYHDREQVAADALFKMGLAYEKQAAKAEYDQSTAANAITTFTDFMTLYPDDARVADAQAIILKLRTEQARGNFGTAQFYEKNRNLAAAKVYYNEVVTLLLDDPNSPYAVEARARLDALNRRLQSASN